MQIFIQMLPDNSTIVAPVTELNFNAFSYYSNKIHIAKTVIYSPKAQKIITYIRGEKDG